MQSLLDAVLNAFSPGFEPIILPGLRFPDGRSIYLPTIGLLLDLRELKVEAVTLQQAADRISEQRKTPESDDSGVGDPIPWDDSD